MLIDDFKKTLKKYNSFKNSLNVLRCRECDSKNIIGIQYRDVGNSYKYDGVSEYRCKNCQLRWGRWSGRTLKESELEYRYGESPKA